MTAHPVDIWTVSLTDRRALLLTSDEAERAARFHFERDRVRWSCARSALRSILAKYAAADPVTLRLAVTQHGKPHLPDHPDIEFNLSHSGDYALAAVTRGVPVGVDIEHIRANTDMGALLQRLGETNLPAGRGDLYSRWVQREARSKAAGGKLFDPPSPDIYAADLTAPEGYAAAVALRGFAPQPVYFSSL